MTTAKMTAVIPVSNALSCWRVSRSLNVHPKSIIGMARGTIALDNTSCMVPMPSGRIPIFPRITPSMYSSRTGPILPSNVTFLHIQRTPAGARQKIRQRRIQLNIVIVLRFSIANLQNIFESDVCVLIFAYNR